VNSPNLLADAWNEFLTLSGEQRASLGRKCRERIKDLYNLNEVTSAYEGMYSNLVDEP